MQSTVGDWGRVAGVQQRVSPLSALLHGVKEALEQSRERGARMALAHIRGENAAACAAQITQLACIDPAPLRPQAHASQQRGEGLKVWHEPLHEVGRAWSLQRSRSRRVDARHHSVVREAEVPGYGVNGQPCEREPASMTIQVGGDRRGSRGTCGRA